MAQARSHWLQRLAAGAIDLLLPAHCLACNADLEDTAGGISYCSDCRTNMTQQLGLVCQRCASRVPNIPGATADCSRCREQNFWFDRTLALGEHTGLLREQLLIMKTDRSERLANSLAPLMLTQLEQRLRAFKLDAIVPIPMHAWRRLARGTNPPTALAAALSRQLKRPMFPRLLRKLRPTRPQVGLSQPARFLNVRGQISVRAGYQLKAPHVLLVDDILTTGATCSEAARVLKRAGAAQVTVLVAARTLKE